MTVAARRRPACASGRGTAAALAACCALAGAACSPGPIDIAGSELLDGMVAHWSMDETSGSAVRDSSGQGHDGVLALGSSGARIADGRFGGAVHFQGGTEIAVRQFPDATLGWTVALWVRPTVEDKGLDFVTLISTEIPFVDPTPGGGWQMNIVTPTTGDFAGMTGYQFGYWIGMTASDYFVYNCACMQPGTWTHIAGVVDGAARTLTFYAQGTMHGSGVPPAEAKPIGHGFPTLYMGRWQPPAGSTDLRPFRGDLDEVVIYGRALGSDEILKLAQAPAPSRR